MIGMLLKCRVMGALQFYDNMLKLELTPIDKVVCAEM